MTENFATHRVVKLCSAGVAAVMLLAGAVSAFAAAPARITVVAVFNPIRYGDNAYVNGQLLGEEQGGGLVVLEQASPPAFTDWTPVAQTTADPAGYYSFKLRPTQTMQYRTSSQGYGSERGVVVGVAPRIRFTAGAAGKSSVRFSGTIAPARPDGSVEIQRQLRGGGWTRVATARLRGGKTFSGRIRARHSVRLRAFAPANGALLNGTSRAVPLARGAATATAAACRMPSITRISTKPSPPVAGRGMTLRVAASIDGGRLYAADVLWGEADKRDHFTLAPAGRRAKVLFDLRHRYAAAGSYRLRVRVFARAGGCKSSRTLRPLVHVTGAIAR